MPTFALVSLKDQQVFNRYPRILRVVSLTHTSSNINVIGTPSKWPFTVYCCVSGSVCFTLMWILTIIQ